MRLREIKKETDKLTSLLKRSEAAYKALPVKDGVLGRLYFSRIEQSKERLEELKRSR